MPKIKVYSTPTCPYCVRAKNYLAERGLVFENIDVAVNQSGLQEMIRLSGQMGVPVIIIDAEVIVGFDKAWIDAKLGIA